MVGRAYLRMRRISRMIRVLRRLRQLRHIDVVGALCVARVDVGAWDAVGLLVFVSCVVSFLFFFEERERVRERGMRGR